MNEETLRSPALASHGRGRCDPIHPRALVDPAARIGKDVVIGAYSIIGPDVVIGDGCRISPHVVIEGRTSLGVCNSVYPYACLGGVPQDAKYSGGETELVIGDYNVIREYATLHLGTMEAGGVTRIGNHSFLMAYTHVAHDCQIGNHVMMTNGAMMAGHVVLEDYAVLSGMVAIHQFVHIGESAYLGAGSKVGMDIAPFCMASGDHCKLRGVNVVGLKRRGFSAGAITAIREAYRLLFRSGLRLEDSLARLNAEFPDHAEVQHMVRFIQNSKRGLRRE